MLGEGVADIVRLLCRFLEAESAGGNFLFSKDRIPSVLFVLFDALA